MFKLDDNLLRELGLGGLPPAEKNKMLAHIYETLEMRVGMKLAEKMTNQQLDEFEAFIDKNDEAGALKWLEGNFPNYKQVVADELEALKAEVRQAAPQIIAASQQAAQQMAQQPYPAQPQMVNPAVGGAGSPQQPYPPAYQQPQAFPGQGGAPAPAQYAPQPQPYQPQPMPPQPADPAGAGYPPPAQPAAPYPQPSYPPQQPPAPTQPQQDDQSTYQQAA